MGKTKVKKTNKNAQKTKKKYIKKKKVIYIPKGKIENGLKLIYKDVPNPYDDSCKRYSIANQFPNNPSNYNRVNINCVSKLLIYEAKALLYKQDWIGLKELLTTAVKALYNGSSHNMNLLKFVSLRYVFMFLLYHPNDANKMMISEILKPYMDKLDEDTFLKKILKEHYSSDNFLSNNPDEDDIENAAYVETSESE